jgi:putative RecB family exonuclease
MLLKDIHESFRQHWHRVAEGRTDIKYADGKDFNTYLIQGVDILTAWYSKLPDDGFKVIGIEEAFSFNLPGIPVPVIGAIDLLEQDDSGTIIISDWKTAGRGYNSDEIDGNQQLTTYQIAIKAGSNGFGGREILLKLDCLIKTKKPRFEQYYTTRSYVDELRLIRKIEKVWEGISAGVFLPNDQSWRHKNCAFRKACDAWFLRR